MPLEFSFWSFFYVNHQFRPWLELGDYVTWDGKNSSGVCGLQYTQLSLV